MFTTKLGSRLKVVSGRHTVLTLFAQLLKALMIVSRILVWLVSLPLVLTLGICIVYQSSICIESQGAFQCLFHNNPLYNAVPRFITVLDKIFHPKNGVIEARETYIKSLYATQL